MTHRDIARSSAFELSEDGEDGEDACAEVNAVATDVNGNRDVAVDARWDMSNGNALRDTQAGEKRFKRADTKKSTA